MAILKEKSTFTLVFLSGEIYISFLLSFRFKAFVAIGDYNGHVGLGVKCSKEVKSPFPETPAHLLSPEPPDFSPLNRTFTAPHGGDSRIGEID